MTIHNRRPRKLDITVARNSFSLLVHFSKSVQKHQKKLPKMSKRPNRPERPIFVFKPPPGDPDPPQPRPRRCRHGRGRRHDPDHRYEPDRGHARRNLFRDAVTQMRRRRSGWIRLDLNTSKNFEKLARTAKRLARTSEDSNV